MALLLAAAASLAGCGVVALPVRTTSAVVKVVPGAGDVVAAPWTGRPTPSTEPRPGPRRKRPVSWIGDSPAMLESLNILHLVLAVGGAGCLYAAILKTRRRAIPRGQLFLPPALALVVAAVATLAQLAMDQPPWIFAAALAIGLALGGARGLRMPLKVDQYWLLLRVRPAAKRLLLWVVALVTADAALERAAAIASQPPGDVAPRRRAGSRCQHGNAVGTRRRRGGENALCPTR